MLPPEYFFPILGMAFALSWGVIGTVRWYLKERMRSERGGPSQDAGRLGALEARVMELEERIDFAERLIARERETQRLPAGD